MIVRPLTQFVRTHKILLVVIMIFVVLFTTITIFISTQQKPPSNTANTAGTRNAPKDQGSSNQVDGESNQNSSQNKNNTQTDRQSRANTPNGNSMTDGSRSNAITSQGSSIQSNPDNNGGSLAPKKNCLANPSGCGYPDATNTGWQHTGVSLTTQTLTGPGELVISQDGTVIDGKAIEGCVRVVADNVTIKRSRVRCDSYFPIVQEDVNVGLLVEDVEIDGLASEITNAGIGFNNYTMRRVNMHTISEGAHPGNNVVIEDSYIHDMTSCETCHSDTIQSDGAQNVIIRHNTVINQAFNKNAVIRLATEGSISFTILVEDNLLEGGNYIFQIREQGHGFPAGVIVRNNRLGRDWRFGPFDIVGGAITASNNYMDDTLEVIIPEQ